jgi:hypothetical protein
MTSANGRGRTGARQAIHVAVSLSARRSYSARPLMRRKIASVSAAVAARRTQPEDAATGAIYRVSRRGGNLAAAAAGFSLTAGLVMNFRNLVALLMSFFEGTGTRTCTRVRRQRKSASRKPPRSGESAIAPRACSSPPSTCPAPAVIVPHARRLRARSHRPRPPSHRRRRPLPAGTLGGRFKDGGPSGTSPAGSGPSPRARSSS